MQGELQHKTFSHLNYTDFRRYFYSDSKELTSQKISNGGSV